VEFVSGGNLVAMLIFVGILSLILGMGLPTTANYIVVSSLMAGVVVELGAEGGLLVPLDERHTVRDLIRAVNLPVVVVCRSGLGTLNHTAMTVELLRAAGQRVVGLIINHGPRSSHSVEAVAQGDPSRADNPRWLQHLTGCPVLAEIPAAEAPLRLARERLPAHLAAPLEAVDWMQLAQRGHRVGVCREP